eukprot:6451041-Amphidinium_carterae.1
MYEVTGNVYGFANAPESFARKVNESMTSLDRWLASSFFDMDKIRGSFTWGSWQLARAVSPNDGKTYSQKVTFQASRFIFMWMLPATQPHLRGQGDLPTSRFKEYRFAVGSLQWLCSSMRAGLAAVATSKPSYPDLLSLNEYWQFALECPMSGVRNAAGLRTHEWVRLWKVDKSEKVTGSMELMAIKLGTLKRSFLHFLNSFFKGGTDSPLDPDSFKGQPTERFQIWFYCCPDIFNERFSHVLGVKSSSPSARYVLIAFSYVDVHSRQAT